ncbi:metal ABC transporter substrate-binding protein [Gordonia soli]|uniref:Manganese ABC transporter substrate-binding protein n=1 Tax=Gordonia soli NBRC 108243 TaxID=1223545 RepID=M0QF03_9ACTN|nr:metal ABC transporter substrate-binding protein [Gordonia soli]GAC67034.1 manganese ABC transporter substrate-binding protein [Gordonia soli NBRC 108243]
MVRQARRRRIAALISTAVTLAVGASMLTGCSSTGRDDGKLQALTTFTVLADMARNVGGSHVDVRSITKVGAEIHGYEPTPGDLHKAVDADVILVNGLNLEAWFERFIRDIDVPRVTLSDGVAPMSITEDAYAGKPNPHAWMSPRSARVYVENIRAAFTRLDPAHAAEYRRNAQRYTDELDAEDARLRAAVDSLAPDQRALVSCEGAFSYLARDAGLTERYIWPVNAEQQATPQQMRRTIDFVDERRVPAVFCESTVSDAPMQQVHRATGARMGGTLYVDSLSEPDGPVPTYLGLIRHDIATIIDGLTGKEQHSGTE